MFQVIILINFVSILVQVLSFAVFIRALLSWFPVKPDNPLVVILFQITEPVLAPLRKVVPMVGMMDITPLVAIIVLQIVSGLIGQLAYYYY
ncbi:MAG: YggT family protein [Chloroflexota bacterium]|nr:MAG: YggT family protein [Chloroflexota bacterium]